MEMKIAGPSVSFPKFSIKEEEMKGICQWGTVSLEVEGEKDTSSSTLRQFDGNSSLLRRAAKLQISFLLVRAPQ